LEQVQVLFKDISKCQNEIRILRERQENLETDLDDQKISHLVYLQEIGELKERNGKLEQSLRKADVVQGQDELNEVMQKLITENEHLKMEIKTISYILKDNEQMDFEDDLPHRLDGKLVISERKLSSGLNSRSLIGLPEEKSQLSSSLSVSSIAKIEKEANSVHKNKLLKIFPEFPDSEVVLDWFVIAGGTVYVCTSFLCVDSISIKDIRMIPIKEIIAIHKYQNFIIPNLEIRKIDGENIIFTGFIHRSNAMKLISQLAKDVGHNVVFYCDNKEDPVDIAIIEK